MNKNIVILMVLGTTLSQTYGLDFIERTLQLSPRVQVDWTADLLQETITFQVTVETRGFIGFGLSPKGGMNGADVIIGGVLDNGESYFTDRWASTTAEPQIDAHQDWFLIQASENTTHTVLIFNRTLDTCDSEDLAITNDTVKYIWSLGTTDEIKYHGADRGSSAVNILDPPMPEYDISQFIPWDIKVNTSLPTMDTIYWCTVHKTPRFPSKHQIVGFATQLESPDAVRFNHHLNLRVCRVVRGSPEHELVESYVNHPGGLCYEEDGTGIQQLHRICGRNMYVWAKGGVPLFLPEHVGLPLNDDGIEEYIYLDMHYDNPQLVAGVQYDTGVRVYFTANLRQYDAALAGVSYSTDKTLFVPPNSANFKLMGHCSPDCTSELPDEGVEIFNVLHHSHLAGRKSKLRLFRPQPDGTHIEIPWISNDDQYDFDFQQSRPLKENVRIFPRDHLTVECEFDNTWNNPSKTTFGGFSTREEMCQAFFLYYPAAPLTFCSSYTHYNTTLPSVGIEKWDSESDFLDPTIVLPEEYSGKTMSTVFDELLTWTTGIRDQLQETLQNADQIDTCHGGFGEEVTDPTQVTWINYPKNIIPYIPPETECGKPADQPAKNVQNSRTFMCTNSVNSNLNKTKFHCFGDFVGYFSVIRVD